MIWKPVDWIADWIGDRLSFRWQKRIGVVSLLTSFIFLAYLPFSAEPMGIFIMSFLALVFGAVSIIAAVEAAEKADQNGDS